MFQLCARALAEADEFIVDLCFFDHSVLGKYNGLGPKLLVVTNQAYYVSAGSYNDPCVSPFASVSSAIRRPVLLDS